MKIPIIISLCTALLLSNCTNQKEDNALKDSLLFYASFDQGIGADFAKGDPLLYDSPNRKAKDSTSNNLSYAAIKHQKTGGVSGGSLNFYDKKRAVAYFKSKSNLNYTKENWQGTISFWLKLDPEKDLKPGYCDPIQITDVAYNDASIWVDFTKDDIPRQFRLGVLGDLDHWNPEKLESSENKAYEDRLVRIKQPPFSSSKWTHIIITHQLLGNQKEEGMATLYMNGIQKGTIKHNDPFNWDLDQSNIYLGLSYIGLFDELMIFDRPLKEQEIKTLGNVNEIKTKLSL